jgi:RNA polymerase sigma-70 factor (ECF subfamily)
MAQDCEDPMVERGEVPGARPDAEFGDLADDPGEAGLAVGAPSPDAAIERSGGGAALEDDAVRAARAEDHALVRRAQAGDESAFEALVRRHEQRAWRVARNLVASDEDAHDLAQEAFLRVFRNLANFDFQHGFTTWLYRIVTNLAIDLLRKRRTAISTTRSDPEEGDYDLPDARVERPSDGLERGELAQDVHACLAALAPHFQSVLMLREMEGLPCNEIAHIVGATHVTVRWRLHRGRKLFQEEWERRKRLSQSGGAGSPRANATHPARVDRDGSRGEGREQ